MVLLQIKLTTSSEGVSVGMCAVAHDPGDKLGPFGRGAGHSGADQPRPRGPGQPKTRARARGPVGFSGVAGPGPTRDPM